MYFVYYHKATNKYTLPNGFRVEQVEMNPFSSLHSFLWYIMKGKGFYTKYALVNSEGQNVSYAEVLNNCPFLRFLPKGAIHIGPCFTSPEFRGNGYYPMLIKYIASQYEDKDCYMFVHESNIASVHGIEKASFIRVGSCKKFLNIYY